ncbi:hypothetical protein C9422_18680 [Pseudomonas sp. B1(2018)]|uniref:hypothetical protein n=1 Tax=Pseudomonas sp. B1(2018) TaxID=2233856 RepID=UPI000D5D16CF|nr:hypothetical protein [Pseudomonas sp. B1(2018)]PVZ56550.1 hypothetical protein C9422_18680 [Pseudomonas sp. B1(2018)]
MNTILQAADAFLCVLVVIAAAEYLRRVRPIDEPLLSISFYLVAIAAFGSFIFNIKGHPVSPFTMTMHAAVILYAIARRGHICKLPG